MNKHAIKPFLWGAIAGAVGLAIVIFGSGMAVTGQTASENARMSAQSAVTATLAKICVAQFETAVDRDTKLAAMKGLDSWQRGNFVNQQGWATMPGSDSGSNAVASDCAQRIAQLPS